MKKLVGISMSALLVFLLGGLWGCDSRDINKALLHKMPEVFEKMYIPKDNPYESFDFKVYLLFKEVLYVNVARPFGRRMVDLSVRPQNIRVLIDKSLPGTALSVNFSFWESYDEFTVAYEEHYLSCSARATIWVQTEDEKAAWEKYLERVIAQEPIRREIQLNFLKGRYKKIIP